MTMPFDRPPPRRPYAPKRQRAERFFLAKACVLSVTPVSETSDFEVILVGDQGARFSFLCDMPAARRWLTKRDDKTFVEIGARQWFRRPGENR